LKKKSFIWPLITLLAGIFFIKISINFQFTRIKSLSNEPIDILSYNADFFHLRRDINDPSDELINWIVDDTSSIKCIQEYISYKNLPAGDLSGQILADGYHKFSYLFEDSEDTERGLAIFSRFPIINKGSLLFNPGTKNNCIYVDLVVSKDTIRVYNLHLSSMSIPEMNNKYLLRYGGYIKSVISKLKNGAIKHSKEINSLIEHTSICPYPYIICGDFNETPYSYNYLKLRKYYTNAFEKAGSGFGFTFNGKVFFLRIDHQFYSKGILPIKFRVDHKIRKSGHFPTRGIYEIL
jgi:endonuclease/exonuclease/phosphatase family metal-dependent hydrolase